MASGIESLHRINAVDLGNRQVAAIVGIGRYGQSAKVLIVVLNGNSQATLAAKFRASMIGAAGTSS
ncbi:hypothetical protein F4560_008219 [Saccharothrix ecbatanensis]|uniref:Uncharacterized protein n=1 Tax=Saccharothrix ecbatanensis TaxID=1105145 RepID=A0A7W9M5Q7_9PSEU|nr:hypothetical protein [Saccharothrix ecbatanensis]MBB5808451.1 hypothetical protein [Saccharothrix ecbatanensis]